MLSSKNKQLLNKAIRAREDKEFTKALDIISTIQKENENDSRTIFEKAVILKRMNNYEEALREFESILFTKERNYVLLEMGNIYYSLNQYSIAMCFFEDLYSEGIYLEDKTQGNKDRVAAMYHMGDCYKRLGNYHMARNCYRKILKEETSSPIYNPEDKYFAYNKIGNAYLEEGKVSEALNNYMNSCSTCNEFMFVTLLQMAKLYLNNHDLEDAKDTLNYILSVPESLISKKSKKVTDIILNAKFLLAKVELLNIDFNNLENNEAYINATNILIELLNTKYSKMALEKLIFLNFKIGDYRKSLQYIIKYIKTKNKDYKFDKEIYNIENIILSKLDKKENNHILKEYQNYNKELVIKKIKARGNVRNIEDFFYQKKGINKDNYYGSDIYDNYYVYIPDIAILNGEPTDFVHIKTLVNSSHIIDILPSKSLNNELKRETKISLQKKKL